MNISLYSYVVKAALSSSLEFFKEFQTYLRRTFLDIHWNKGSRLKDDNLSYKTNSALIWKIISYALKLFFIFMEWNPWTFDIVKVCRNEFFSFNKGQKLLTYVRFMFEPRIRMLNNSKGKWNFWPITYVGKWEYSGNTFRILQMSDKYDKKCWIVILKDWLC